MKANTNHELLKKIFTEQLEKKIIDVVEMDISDEEKIKMLVEFTRGLEHD